MRFYGWNTTKRKRNVFYFLRILNLWSWKFVIQWSWEFNFDDLLFFLIQKKTKDHDQMILQIAISMIHDQKRRDLMIMISAILWSRDYDPRKTVILNFKIIISRDPVVLIPFISVINVIMDHRKWILMCEKVVCPQ